MNPRIKTVVYKKPYKLILSFTNGEQKEFDLSPYLSYPVYKNLKDESFCNKVKILNGTIAWNDEIDFDPDTLYLESKTLNTGLLVINLLKASFLHLDFFPNGVV